MPIYEYKCEKCGVVIEKIQKFSDPPLGDCEKCDGKVNKLLSQSSFTLKGSGWYVTDYAKKSNGEPKSEKTESSSETKTESNGEPKSEKTESSSETKTESKAEPTSTATSPASGSSSDNSGASTNS
jgi:putative FmdB family regulatory protein